MALGKEALILRFDKQPADPLLFQSPEAQAVRQEQQQHLRHAEHVRLALQQGAEGRCREGCLPAAQGYAAPPPLSHLASKANPN